ncbi:rRNA maturation RNase YbeY [Flavobacterium sp.]|uniref:rRNA maturation RNase YbeY n=1 Tax=Flavobacterium sp. TaxID=239 RepID=UPI0025DF2B2C|nr:rRNA maturation RNase YbeY [Flavobacterium sp.]
MINFNYEFDYKLVDEELYSDWLSNVIISESKTEGELNYIFCDDYYLLKLNNKYLSHDTLTDIISFDYSIGNKLQGDIFISVERVQENASDFKVSFDDELKRVLIHGLLHLCGYKDKSEQDEIIMRQKEDEKMKMFHVKQN